MCAVLRQRSGSPQPLSQNAGNRCVVLYASTDTVQPESYSRMQSPGGSLWASHEISRSPTPSLTLAQPEQENRWIMLPFTAPQTDDNDQAWVAPDHAPKTRPAIVRFGPGAKVDWWMPIRQRVQIEIKSAVPSPRLDCYVASKNKRTTLLGRLPQNKANSAVTSLRLLATTCIRKPLCLVGFCLCQQAIMPRYGDEAPLHVAIR